MGFTSWQTPGSMQQPGRCKDSENVPKGGPELPPPPQGHTQHWPPPPGRMAWPALRRPLGRSRQGSRSPPRLWPQAARRPSPWSPFPLALVQEGGGEAWGRTTGAKALFCFTAEMTLAGENEKMPWALLQFEGRVTEEAAMVGLDGTTATKQRRSGRAAPRGNTTQSSGPPGTQAHSTGVPCFWCGPFLDNRQTLVSDSFPIGRPRFHFRFGLGFQCDRVGPV